MPIYLYKGYDAQTGALRKGKIEADSIKSAKKTLRAKYKIIPAELKEELSAKAPSRMPFTQKTVTLPDLAIMTRQFATLQSAHVPLDECLKALTEQTENILLRNTLSALREAVSEGKSLGDAMKSYPSIFNNLYVNMVKAGEASGNLGLVLERLAGFIEYQLTIENKVKSAMTYPIVMMIVAFAILLGLFVGVIPQMQNTFESMNIELPGTTKAIIAISDFIINQWYIPLGVIFSIIFASKSWYQSEKGRKTFDRLILKTPVFGPLVVRLNVSKFTKTLSTLLGSGVPIIQSLEIAKNIISNKTLAHVIVEAKQAIQEGKTLASVLANNEHFPPLVSHMIKTGEKTGELETMLTHVATAYDAEVDKKIDDVISLLGPIMIIILGVIVGVIVFAVLEPMMSMMGQLGE